MVYVGKISYGMYLYHLPVMEVIDVGTFGFNSREAVVARFLTALAAASLSYRFLERPLRSLPRPGASKRSVSAGEGPGGDR